MYYNNYYTSTLSCPTTGLLSSMFDLLYDLEVVREDVFQRWREEGMQAYTAIQSVKTFLDWLDSSAMEVNSI